MFSEEDAQTSSKQISKELDMSKRFALRTLRKNKFRPHKVKLVQELSDELFDRCLGFAEI